MRFLAAFLFLLSLVALPLAAAVPKHKPYSKHPFSEISQQLANRAYFTDLSQFNFAPFNVTEIRILCERPKVTVDYACNLTFNWHDPNSVRQNRVTSGTCRTSWQWDGVTRHNASLDGSDPVAHYRACWVDQTTYFKVAVPGFWHPGFFSLELAHHYQDDENFTKPWDFPTTFADVHVNLCEQEVLKDRMYHYHPGPVNGTVVGLID